MGMNEALTLCTPSTDFVRLRLDVGNFIKALPFEQTVRAMKSMISGACIIRGATLSEEATLLTAQALADILTEEYPTLTIAEIGKAIKRGSYGAYGEVYGVNAASLFGMVRGYIESEEKAALTKRVIEARIENERQNARDTEEFMRQHPGYKPTTL